MRVTRVSSSLHEPVLGQSMFLQYTLGDILWSFIKLLKCEVTHFFCANKARVVVSITSHKERKRRSDVINSLEMYKMAPDTFHLNPTSDNLQVNGASQ